MDTWTDPKGGEVALAWGRESVCCIRGKEVCVTPVRDPDLGLLLALPRLDKSIVLLLSVVLVPGSNSDLLGGRLMFVQRCVGGTWDPYPNTGNPHLTHHYVQKSAVFGGPLKKLSHKSIPNAKACSDCRTTERV